MISPEPLLVLAFVGEGPTAMLFDRVFAPRGDRLLFANDETKAVELARAERPDLAFVDLALDHQAGLALVHHLRTILPETSVYALTNPEAMQLGSQALSLGSAGVILHPASGDELVSAATELREHRAALREREALLTEVDFARRAVASVSKIAELAEATDRNQAAAQLATLFAETTGAASVAVYIKASEHANRLIRASISGSFDDAPAFADEMGVMTWAQQSGCEIVALSLGPLCAGHIILREMRPLDTTGRSALELLASQAATLMSLLAERERSTRGAIQDLTTSAYTFSYFVDIAGREIDKARRYDRRFALSTIYLDESASPERAAELVELVLATIRDTDVLARVDEREFYLLLPETDGLGAQRCRRRVLERVQETEDENDAGRLTMGLAVFPHDGSDLSRLLRVAKRRAEARRESAVYTLALHAMQLDDIVDALLDGPDAEGPDGPKHLHISLAEAFAVTTTAITEALRGGQALVVVAEHAGLGLASAVRAALAPERERAELYFKDAQGSPDRDALELLAIVAEHGAYVIAGRSKDGSLRAVHAADPLLADLVMQRLGVSGGPH